MPTILVTVQNIFTSPIFIILVFAIISLFSVWKYARKNQTDTYAEFDKLFFFFVIWVLITRLLFIFLFYDNSVAWNLLPFRYVIDPETGDNIRIFFDTYPWRILRLNDFNYFISGSVIPLYIFCLIESKFKVNKKFNNLFARFGRITYLFIACFLIIVLVNNQYGIFNSITIPLTLGYLLVVFIISFNQKFSNIKFFRVTLVILFIIVALQVLLNEFSLKSLVLYMGVAFLVLCLYLIEKYLTISELEKLRENSTIDMVKQRAKIVRSGLSNTRSFNQTYREVNEATLASFFGKNVKSSINKIFSSKDENNSK